MKTADIVTSSNVSIEYELASLVQRIVAFIIDLLILLGYLIVLIIVAQSFNDFSDASIFMALLWYPAFFAYHLISEVFFGGQSIGKRAMGIKVVGIDGQNPTLGQYATRWAFRMIDIFITLGGLATLFISSSARSQRLGDQMAQTLVIKLNPSRTYSIHDIMSIKKSEGYEMTYPGVTRFSDDDMILLKNILDRRKKHKNEAHNQLIHRITDKICKELNITVPKNREKIEFLNTVLQDYIVITRS